MHSVHFLGLPTVAGALRNFKKRTTGDLVPAFLPMTHNPIAGNGNLGSQSVNQNGKKEITAIAIHHPSFSLHTPPINYQKDVENPPFDLPSGKRLHNYGKSPCLMGKSTISMAMVNSYVCLPEGTGWGPPVISWFINHCNPQ